MEGKSNIDISHVDLHDVSMIFFFDKLGTFLRYINADPEFPIAIPPETFIGKKISQILPLPMVTKPAIRIIREAINEQKTKTYTKTFFNITCRATLLPMPCGNAVIALIALTT